MLTLTFIELSVTEACSDCTIIMDLELLALNVDMTNHLSIINATVAYGGENDADILISQVSY